MFQFKAVWDKKHKYLFNLWKEMVCKKSFESDTDTKIGPWFRFSIQKPGFCRILEHTGGTFFK